MKHLVLILILLINLPLFAQVKECDEIQNSNDFVFFEMIKYNPASNYFSISYAHEFLLRGEVTSGIEVVKGYLKSGNIWSDGWVQVNFNKTRKEGADFKLIYRNVPQEIYIERYIRCY